MSLIDDMSEEFIYMVKTKHEEPEGGFTNTWEEGAHFNAALTMDTSMLAQIAGKQGVTSVYTLTTKRGLGLSFPDAIKRVRDGQTFRVTSDAKDKKTPVSARLDIEQVTAEAWALS